MKIPNLSHRKKPLTTVTITTFQQLLLHYYQHNKRDFPWRETTDPYKILVSEIMLQQTQTKRVEKYYLNFLHAFPTIRTLAHSKLRDVLILWQGLGYNRRAKYLHHAAKKIEAVHNGTIPQTLPELTSLSGVGLNTACAVMAYAFNQPVVFIETNIRTVFLYSFFRNSTNVSDKVLTPLLKQTLYKKNPRNWYYALTDYGAFIKTNVTNPSRNSKHYKKQSRFEGSDRQIRAAIITLLTDQDNATYEEIKTLHTDKTRVKRILKKLIGENMISKNNSTYSI